MNGQMMNYRSYLQNLKTMPQSIMPSELPKIKINHKGLLAFAKEKGVKVIDLSEQEKQQFIQPY